MIDTVIVRRRQRRLGFSGLWLLIGLGLIVLLAGCAAGISGIDSDVLVNFPGSCDVSTASADCDNDGVLNSEDEFPTDASRSCAVTDGNSAPGTRPTATTTAIRMTRITALRSPIATRPTATQMT